MKVAITAQGTDLNAQVDPRFGRCQTFLIVNTETGAVEAVENPNVSTGSGAGIQAAKVVIEKGASAVLTGNVGPNAFQTLSAAGIAIYAGVSGAVAQALEQLKEGTLATHSEPSVWAHHGMQTTPEFETSTVDKKRIAVAAENDQGLDATVSAHFGRCPYYTIVDVENGQITISFKVENPYFNAHGDPGLVPAFIRDQKADVIIAGGMGPMAVNFFNQFNIEVVTGASGKIKDVVDGYLQGTVSGSAPCKH